MIGILPPPLFLSLSLSLSLSSQYTKYKKNDKIRSLDYSINVSFIQTGSVIETAAQKSSNQITIRDEENTKIEIKSQRERERERETEKERKCRSACLLTASPPSRRLID